ncbi:Sec7 domain protein [Ostertagia ostertagi]
MPNSSGTFDNRRLCRSSLSTNHCSFVADSLMSPRLVQRKFPAGADRTPFTVTHVPCASACNGNVVWVPRATITSPNLSNSNSLTRIDKTGIRSEPEHLHHQPRYHNEQERKRQYRIALNFFNKKPERGVQLLTAWRFVDDSAESLANLLFGRRGLSKQMIGEYIATLHSTFHSCVLKYFIGQIDVRGMEVDVALRKAMQYFFLPKEAEKIDKIIQEFAQHYAKCNPKRTKQFRGGWDTIHMIAFAVIMLNTDLHSPNLKASQRMQMDQFVHNLRGQDKMRGEKEGIDIDRSCLQGIYERIRAEEIRPGDDHVAQVARVDAAIIAREKPRLTETQRRLVCYCRLQQVMDPSRKQSIGSHERDVFLFNDMLVVAKAINKRRTSAHTSYTLKHWMPLLGASVLEFKVAKAINKRRTSAHTSYTLKHWMPLLGASVLEFKRLTETQRRLVCYCRLQQVMDPSRKQSIGSHERDVFLFNDMLVVAKAINKRRTSAHTSYTLKHWMPLLGASVLEFKRGPYEYGLSITPPAPDNQTIYFNARNYDDRCRFVADVLESIRESCQMEEVRLELEMEKHTLRTDNQRDSGLPEIDGPDCLLSRPVNAILGGASLVPTFRRLSFNSLDSGVVEETCESNA